MRTSLDVRRPLRFKIFMVSLLPVMALILVAYSNSRHLSALGESAEQIMDRNYRSIKAAQEARQILESNQVAVLMELFGTGDPDRNSINERELGEALEICRRHIAESGESLLVEELWRKYLRYAAIFDEDALEKLAVHPSEFAELTANMIAGLNAVIDLNEQGMEKAEKRTRSLARQAQRMSLVVLCITIIFIILLSFVFSTLLTNPIKRLAQRLYATHEGGDRYPTLPVTSDDEIGVLTREFNRLFRSLASYDQHNAAILAAEKAKVHQAEEARGKFIADLSHQLKTPMTSLAMSVNLLHERRSQLSDEQVSLLLDTATEDCDRMAKLLNELVDIARLEAMIRPPAREAVDISDMITQSLKPLGKQAEEKGLRLIYEIEPGLPPVLLDATRFPWVLTNLVGNALRYTDPGGTITLAARQEEGRVWFGCADTGCGIAPQHLPHIFDRYSQFAERERMGAIGLGLAIVKEIIEQHGGEIEVLSQLGKGTTFRFWIPQQ